MGDDKKDLEVITCCKCSITFGMTPALHALREKDFDNFFCPNGHGQAYVRPAVDPKETELKALRAEVSDLKSKVESLTKDNHALTTELEVWKPRLDQEGRML